MMLHRWSRTAPQIVGASRPLVCRPLRGQRAPLTRALRAYISACLARSARIQLRLCMGREASRVVLGLPVGSSWASRG